MSLYLPATCDSGWKSIFRVVSRLVLPSHDTGHISARPGHCSALYGFYWSVNSLHKVNSNSNVENLLKEGRDMTWNINNALKLDLRFLPHLLRLCKVQLEYFDFLWNYFQSTLFPLPRGFLEWETTWITKLKKVKGFWSFTWKSSTWLKELDLLLRCCLVYVGLHILILGGPTFRKPGDGWQWTLRHNQQSTKSCIEGGGGVREPGVQYATLHH